MSSLLARAIGGKPAFPILASSSADGDVVDHRIEGGLSLRAQYADAVIRELEKEKPDAA